MYVMPEAEHPIKIPNIAPHQVDVQAKILNDLATHHATSAKIIEKNE
jgi:hypothetical protein